MPSEPHTPESRPRPTRINGRKRAEGGRPYKRSGDLAALSDASRHYAQAHNDRRSHRTASQWLIAFAAALLVGLAVAFLLPSAHICAASLRFAAPPTSAQRAQVRKALMDFAWRDQAKQAAPELERRAWFVDEPSHDTLRLCLHASDRSLGVQRVRLLSESFIASIEKEAAVIGATPTDGERALSLYAARLDERLQAAQAQLESTTAGEPENDPTPARSALTKDWETARARFIDLRLALSETNAQYDQLRNERNPTSGIVATEDRRVVLEKDDALQQDLGELTVNLTEVKLHLLNVWQASAGPLELLQTASRDLAEIRAADVGATGTAGEMVTDLRSTGLEYVDLLTAFATEWNKEFVTLRRRPIDPMTGAVLELHRRMRTRLSDFLFQAGKHTAKMRGMVDGVGDLPGDRPRLHVLHASLMRFFRAVQMAHHRFEFSAGAIETQANFKLDTAQRAARGLFRRSQIRITNIDRLLQEQARQRAVAQRAEDLQRTEKRLASLREAAYLAVERLVAVQEGLNVNAGLTESYLRSTLLADMSKGRIDFTKADLAATQGTLAQLTDRRMQSIVGVNLELASVDVIGRTGNVPQRLQLGGLSALVTLLVVGLVQWVMVRRGH
ncbi:MAG: hypothetical protein IH987_11790 [Planctomycetes bacterium]|nr:hypothetical protein [Planctomycetota bacterium]